MKVMLAVALVAALAPAAASAQSTVFIPDVIELSGAGAVSGTNWRDGVTLAVDEINAKGGILGRKINTPHIDTQSNPGVSRAQVQKVLDSDPYVVLGPIYSGSVKVNMKLTEQAGVPQIVGAEAADITQLGNPFVFRTAFGQQTSVPKLAAYIQDRLNVKRVGVVWVNNDFGKGGRDSFLKEMASRGVKVVADLSTESGQADFAADVAKLKNADPEAVFVYCNEEEAARFLIAARRQGLNATLLGETTLLSQKVIELAGDAANGVRGHVGLSSDAPVPLVREFAEKFKKRFGYTADHNGQKGYIALYMIKHVTEKIGKFDRKLFADTLHGLTITPEQEPGILMEASWDAKGDIDRVSFLAEVSDRQQKIIETLPKLAK
jgi:branched-chain amino acid transport system substrate-binding protein